jgi:hypothetical protein
MQWPAGTVSMSVCWIALVPSETKTRLLVMKGQDEVLRAELPPLSKVAHENAVKRVLEGLSLWLDQRVCVALSVREQDVDLFRLDLVDELGAGARSIYYAVEPIPPGRLPRPRRLRGVGDFTDLRQLYLWASSLDAP